MSQDFEAVKRAEQALLGSMLRFPPSVGDVIQLVHARDFREDGHAKIFAAITGLYDAGGTHDLVSVAEHLTRSGHLQDAGGYGYLGELFDNEPTGALAEQYAEYVRDYSTLRSLAVAASEIARDASSPPGPASEVLESAERRVFEIANARSTNQTVHLRDAVNEAFDRLDARASGKATAGIATPYPDLDHLTGGLHNGELVVIAARTSVGKTSFALDLARHTAVKHGLPVLFCSLEMSRAELAERLLSAEGRVDSSRLRKGNLSNEDFDALARAGDLLRKAPLFIDDAGTQGMLRIAANARRHKLRHKLQLIVVDYLQLVQAEDRKVPRHEQVASISRRLKAMARELSVPVIALSQLNRAVEERTGNRPRLSDLRESGAQEQDADTVLFLHRPDYHDASDRPGQTDLIIAKQRNGPTGDVTLYFRKEYMRFESFDPCPPAFMV